MLFGYIQCIQIILEKTLENIYHKSQSPLNLIKNEARKANNPPRGRVSLRPQRQQVVCMANASICLYYKIISCH